RSTVPPSPTVADLGHRCAGSAAPARSAAGVALEAGAVADQREVSALPAALALVALDPGLRAQVGLLSSLGDAGHGTSLEVTLQLAGQLLHREVGVRLDGPAAQLLLHGGER